MDWVKMQDEVREWRARCFPSNTLHGQLMGATGELAEAGQHWLKGSDNRVDGVDHWDGMIDALGDALIYMMGAADQLDVTLEECFNRAWEEVKEREHATWGEDKDGYKRDVAKAKAEGYDWS